MASHTKIGWCSYLLPDGQVVHGHTHNEWWGCAPKSRGCRFCYAADTAARWHPDENLWRRKGPRRLMSENTRNNPYRWNRAAEKAGRPELVFCSSMSDVFDEHPMVAPWRANLWPKIEATPWLIWMLLTHRPENIAAMVPPAWLDGDWPAHVWIGATVEDDRYAADRIEPLSRLWQAPVRFLSVEPMVGPVDPTAIDFGPQGLLDALTGVATQGPDPADRYRARAPINWVIGGGESGNPNKIARMDPVGLTTLAAQCADRGVPFFAKQTGTLLAREWGLASSKGDDPAEWPADVRGLWVQQHPPIRIPAGVS